MARHRRSSKLETRASRLRLDIKRKPYFLQVAPRVGLGYRRNQGPGTWVARGADGHGGYWTKAFALADDHEDADGNSVLTFWQAQDRAKEIVRGKAGGTRPVTVAEALEHYAADLKGRGGSTENVSRVISNLPPALAAKTVSILSSRELRHWRDGMVAKGQKSSTADRTARMMKAALNLASRDDPRVQNSSAWKSGLARLPEEEPPPNKIIGDGLIRKIVAAAHRLDPCLGLMVEVAAVTGSRPSQILRLEVADLRDTNPAAPQLMMPSSRKGRRRRVTRTPLPIPPELGKALRHHVADRDRSEVLLINGKGKLSYGVSRRGWIDIVSELGLDADVTLYSLRHSSIVRQLLKGVPTRVVAAHHDTSVPVIEHTYSRYIGTVSDQIVRGSLIDLSTEEAGR
jgi:integrase